jgi:hypothetical protein
MHLLVIEDNPDLVANLSDYLEGHGHTLELAYNAIPFRLQPCWIKIRAIRRSSGVLQSWLQAR